MDPETRFSIQDRMRELVELGLQGARFRLAWELKRRIGWFRWTDREPRFLSTPPVEVFRHRIQGLFAEPAEVKAQIGPLLSEQDLLQLQRRAHEAADGKLLFFSHATVDCGSPIRWHRDPITNISYDARLHWLRAHDAIRVGDIKDLWEMGRFSHAYLLGRAATFLPPDKGKLAAALQAQVEHFIDTNPFPWGVHWASGQEITFRLFAWSFALATVLADADDEFLARIADHMQISGVHIARHVDYARYAVRNNHLISEAVGLLLIAYLLPQAPTADRFHRLGVELLSEGVDRQFYRDGAYVQHSHNYHRVALHDLLWAFAIFRAEERDIPKPWLQAGKSSLAFLAAQQAPSGELPNYGSNDGAYVSPLSFCKYEDYRPILQALSAATTGRRLYVAGTWDEEALWFGNALGPPLAATPTESAPAASLHTQPQAGPKLISFEPSGYYVMRGTSAGTFVTFRCGTLTDRFAQIDMNHVDLYWKGHNVLVDAGSYRYSGADKFHRHFMGTDSHNTVMVDGRNQMPHVRKFKTLYPTQARCLATEVSDGHLLVAGEHYGYQRLAHAIHRRALLFVPDEVLVIVDTLHGDGAQSARLHWLCGDYPTEVRDSQTVLQMDLPGSQLTLAVHGADGLRRTLDVVRGQEVPPRGWLSRRYASKIAVPSVCVYDRGKLPMSWVTVVGEPFTAHKHADRWRVGTKRRTVEFSIVDGLVQHVVLS